MAVFVSRRVFLRAAGLVGIGGSVLALAGCGGAATATTSTAASVATASATSPKATNAQRGEAALATTPPAIVPTACPMMLSEIRNEISPARSPGSVSRTTRVRLRITATPLKMPSSSRPSPASATCGDAPVIMAAAPIPASESG